MNIYSNLLHYPIENKTKKIYKIKNKSLNTISKQSLSNLIFTIKRNGIIMKIPWQPFSKVGRLFDWYELVDSDEENDIFNSSQNNKPKCFPPPYNAPQYNKEIYPTPPNHNPINLNLSSILYNNNPTSLHSYPVNYTLNYYSITDINQLICSRNELADYILNYYRNNIIKSTLDFYLNLPCNERFELLQKIINYYINLQNYCNLLKNNTPL